LSEGAADHEICRDLGLSWTAFKRAIERIEARASAESEGIGRYYEKALHRRLKNRNTSLEARFRALMDVLPQAVLVVDGRTGEIKEFNQKACDLFGYTAASFKKLRVEQLMAESLHTIHVAYRLGFLRSVRKRELGYHPPILGLRKDGTEIEMAIALTATTADDDVMVVCSELLTTDSTGTGGEAGSIKGADSLLANQPAPNQDASGTAESQRRQSRS